MSNILVIDDDLATRIFLQRSLRAQGYEVCAVDSGEEGIVTAIAMKPDLIICDWLMPGITGLEVCEVVKKTPELSSTFFLLLTALDTVEDTIRGLDSGADDFLSKPVETSELFARVRAALRISQLNADLQTQKRLLETELGEAAAYVSSILPEPLDSEIINIETTFIPSFQLGGDCFDYFWLDNESLAIYLLDVSGHGLRAALPSLSVVNVLRSRSLPGAVDYSNPVQVLEALNRAFQISDRNDKYFTIWYGVYELKLGQLTYSSAGHPPGILISEGEMCPLKTAGLPIGMFDGARYQSAICDVHGNSSLYLFSDGLYELPQESGSIGTIDEFIPRLAAKHHQAIAEGWDLLTLVKHLINHQSLNNLPDDLSLMQVNFSDLLSWY